MIIFLPMPMPSKNNDNNNNDNNNNDPLKDFLSIIFLIVWVWGIYTVIKSTLEVVL